MATGKLLGIATRDKSRAPMQEFSEIEITRESGCAGDFRGSRGDRQVTVMAQEDWDAACDQLGKELPWTTRRANLLIEGINLAETTGQYLSFDGVVLQITGETDPCQRMEEATPGLMSALLPSWRGGVCCTVIKSGTVAVGAKTSLIDSKVCGPFDSPETG